MNKLKNFYNANGYFFPIDALGSNLAEVSANRLENIFLNPPTNIHHPWNLQAHLLANWIYDLCISPFSILLNKGSFQYSITPPPI